MTDHLLDYQASVLTVCCDLDRHSVPLLWEAVQSKVKPDSQILTVDLQKVRRIDSIGLVFLIHLIRMLDVKTEKISFINLPKEFNTLCHISHITELFQPYIKETL